MMGNCQSIYQAAYFNKNTVVLTERVTTYKSLQQCTQPKPVYTVIIRYTFKKHSHSQNIHINTIPHKKI